jgi:hypothetical protein
MYTTSMYTESTKAAVPDRLAVLWLVDAKMCKVVPLPQQFF